MAERIRVQEEQARLVTIIEATPDFVGYADAKDTHFVFINKVGRKMTGLSEDEDVTQLKIADILPERSNIMFNDEIALEAIRNGNWEGNFVCLNRNNGCEFPVSMVLLSHKAPGGEVAFFFHHRARHHRAQAGGSQSCRTVRGTAPLARHYPGPGAAHP